MADHDYLHGGWKTKYVVLKSRKIAHINGDLIDEDGVKHSVTKWPVYAEPEAGADYFVLRIDEDPHARVALYAYANSIRSVNKVFYLDIMNRLRIYCPELTIEHEETDQ